ncbi:MAG: ABC transporter permease subunit [Candidatus Hodarchaeota archaeon]
MAGNLNQIISRNSTVLEISVFRFLKDKKTIFLGIVGLLPTILALLWSQSKNWSATIQDLRFDYVTLADGLFVNLIVLLLCLILAISTLKDEEESKTISYLLTRPLSRFEIYAMKFLAFEAVAIPLTVGCMLPSYLIMAFGRSPESIFSEFNLFFGSSILIAVEITFYGAIFMLLAILLSKPLIPSFLIAIVERWFLTGILSAVDLGPFAPSYHLAAIGNALIPYGPYTVEKTSTGWESMLLLLLLSVGAVVVGLLVMKNKDFP